jgi:Yersinia/Haemophilus virulence surface antigen
MAFGFDQEILKNYNGRLTSPKEQEQGIVIKGIKARLLNQVDGRTPKDHALEKGLCLGWSAEWIHHQSKGHDFWKWLPTGEGDLIRMAHHECNSPEFTNIWHDEFKRLTPLQKELLQKKAEDHESWARDWIQSKEKLTALPRHKPDKDHKDAVALANKILEGEGYKLITLTLAQKHGGHAVAASVSGCRVVYMDPNGGEAEFDSHIDFGKWFLIEHMPCYKHYGFSDYHIDAFPCPINATATQQEVLQYEKICSPRKRKENRNALRIDQGDLQENLANEKKLAKRGALNRGALNFDSGDLQEQLAEEGALLAAQEALAEKQPLTINSSAGEPLTINVSSPRKRNPNRNALRIEQSSAQTIQPNNTTDTTAPHLQRQGHVVRKSKQTNDTVTHPPPGKRGTRGQSEGDEQG